MTASNKYLLINSLIALIWLVNGLLCKILNLVPRHQQIVAEILGNEHARILTILIGVSEVVMAIWVLSRFKSKLNTYLQISVVLVMNVLEFILVPELLLWGRMNILFALIFVGVVYWNEFVLLKLVKKGQAL